MNITKTPLHVQSSVFDQVATTHFTSKENAGQNAFCSGEILFGHPLMFNYVLSVLSINFDWF